MSEVDHECGLVHRTYVKKENGELGKQIKKKIFKE